MKKILLAFMVLGLILTSCNKEELSKQNKVYTDYELFYNQNENKTHVVARFRIGGSTGTLLELADTSGASVAFNGDLLPYDVWYGGHHKEYAGQLAGGTFVYTNTHGVMYSKVVPTGEAIAFPTDFNTIAKDMTENLVWEGTELTVNQGVGVFIGSWAWSEEAAFWTDDVGAKKIKMSVSKKSDLPLGSSTVYMDRTTEIDVAEGTPKGGRIRYKYRCTNVEVEIIN
ncbi:MAG: hypothetical protein ACI8ZM_004469 [Crocinitomix sp.]|jgi:hypothetical protein